MSGAGSGYLETNLIRLWESYRLLLENCRRDPSEPAVHDVRVAARRLLGALDVCRPLRPRPPLRKLRSSIKGVLDALDDLRDVQVMLLELSRTPETIPQPAAFAAGLAGRGRRWLREARLKLAAVRPSRLEKRIAKLAAALQMSSGDQDAVALSAVDALFARVNHAAQQVNDQEQDSIHRARIAFKRFRYAAEMVEPILPPHENNLFSRMHRFQRTLGDIRDLDILLAAIARFERRQPPLTDPLTPRHVAALCQIWRDRRGQLVAAYHAASGELAAFWRPAPDQRFPWEVNDGALHHSSRHSRNGQSAGRRQPASSDGAGPEEDVSDRPGSQVPRGDVRPDPGQPVRARGPDGSDPGQEA